MKRVTLKLGLLVLTLMVLLNSPLQAVELLLRKDIHVLVSSQARTNSTVLLVTSATAKNIFLGFELDALPEGTKADQIAAATLRLFINVAPAVGNLEIYRADGSWSETTGAVPTMGTLVGTVTLSGLSFAASNYLDIDITTLVRQWMTDQVTNPGLAIKAASGATVSFSFDSKEASTISHAPSLQVAFTTVRTLPKGDISMIASPSGPQP